tara:strand:+ start:1736 stop:2434 length:699 start_codon:yes stop_codon:yes gene_type:complete
MINFLITVLTFFSPSVKLQSGRNINLDGKGPPVLFSPGLFGTMPSFIYSSLIQKIKKNATIITYNDLNPISKNDITDLTNTLSVESIAVIGHSSFNSEVLESNRINHAVLIDPICLPELSVFTFKRKDIYIDYPILLIKADKLFNSEPKLPEWQEPNFIGNLSELKYENVGHPDILDDYWANFAKTNGFWDTTNGILQSFENWKLNSNDIKKVREDYRNFISEKSIEFIFSP